MPNGTKQRPTPCAVMSADQAAGLRQRRHAPSPLFLYCIAESAHAAVRAARVLDAAGRRPLVADGHGRLLQPGGARALFDWTQQLARRALLTLPLEDARVWHAPGVRSDSPGLAEALGSYLALVLDCPAEAAAVPAAAARECLWIEMCPATMQQAYALLKTRSLTGGIDAILSGDLAAVLRVQAACERFLGSTIAARLHCCDNEEDAIAALAVRMP